MAASRATVAARYLEHIAGVIARLAVEELPAIEAAAERVAGAVKEGHLVHTLGCGHSSLVAQEVFYRSGGLMLVNCLFPPGQLLNERPVTITTQMERVPGLAGAALDGASAQAGDVLIVVSSSGRNAVPIEAAVEGKQRGLYVIAVTSSTIAAQTTSRHASGQLLQDVADLVLDNKVIAGDAALELEGLRQRVGATSTVAGAALLQATMARAIEMLAEQGLEPPVFINANIEGGTEHNARVIAEHRDRLRHLV